MSGLFQFIIRIRIFLLFLLLEGISVFLIVNNNNYQGVVFMNSTNELTGKIMEISSTVNGYFYLNQVNAELAAENARLNIKMLGLQSELANVRLDTIGNKTLTQFKYRVAKVINNSVNRSNNYLTLNKGSADGISPGMGVVAASGVIGKVKYCSEHYCTVTSILHSNMLISAAIKRCSAFGTAIWQGNDPFTVNLKFIPRHIKPIVGDTVVTSDYSTVFPSGINIGKVSKLKLNDNEFFYDIKVALGADLSTVSYVYVIENTLKAERESLEKVTSPDLNEH